MKKLALILGLIFLSVATFGFSWSAEVGLDMEGTGSGDPVNHGTGVQLFINHGTISYSGTTVYTGTYALGPLDTAGMYLMNSVPDSTPYLAIQFSVYVKSDGLPMDAEIFEDGHFYNRTYIYDGTGEFANNVSQVEFAIGYNAWHVYKYTYDGTHVDFWIDGVHITQMTSVQPGYSASYYIFGNYYGAFGSNYGNCIFDNIVFATTSSGDGTEIVPVVGSPTFTLTKTRTPLPTATKEPIAVYTTPTIVPFTKRKTPTPVPPPVYY